MCIRDSNVAVDMPDPKENYLNKIDTPAVSEALAAGDMKKAWLAEQMCIRDSPRAWKHQ